MERDTVAVTKGEGRKTDRSAEGWKRKTDLCVCVRERERGGGEKETDRQTDKQTSRVGRKKIQTE